MDMLLVLVGLFFLIVVVVYFKKKDNATFVSKDILELEKELGLENDEVDKILDVTGLKKEFSIKFS